MMELTNKSYLIIGCGITGATLARLLVQHGAKYVKVIEAKSHLGGNVYDQYDEHHILYHVYGPHIFHTNYDEVWKFITSYTTMVQFRHQVLAAYQDQLIPLPINLDSILLMTHQNEKLVDQLLHTFPNTKAITINQLINCNDQALQNLGQLIFDNIYANYTKKMWNISAKDIDKNVLNRLQINLNTQWDYFPNDKYTGIPTNGFTSFIEQLVNHPCIEVFINQSMQANYDLNSLKLLLANHVYDAIFYTGMIDSLFNFKYGHLPYRSLRFEFKYVNQPLFQPTSVVNYPSHPFMTRITDYNFLLRQHLPHTVIGMEYPGQYDPSDLAYNVPYYPINNPSTRKMYALYFQELQQIPNFYCLGRLGTYSYIDMDDSIYQCLQLIKKLTQKEC